MKRIFTLLFFAMFAGQALAQTTFDLGTNVQGVVDGETLTISGTGNMNDFTSSTKPKFGNIKEVIIGEGVTSIGSYAFYNCSGLTRITIPNSVTSIGNYAFLNCSGLTEITIPNSVTCIGSDAFSGCSGLTEVIIPNSVTSIGSTAFSDCSGLTEINVESDNTKYASQDGVLFNKDKTTIICYPAGKTDPEYTIPNSVTSIGDHAFRGCSGLTSVTIPNSVTSIGYGTFYNCSGLTEITIPNSVTSIGSSAFYGCSGLTEITIPNSVTSIGSSAFYGCSGLTEITIPNSVTSIGSSAFSGCSGLTEITIPNSVTSIGNELFRGCSGLTEITIPNSVTTIGSGVFSSCTNLTSVAIPNSVTSIGGYVFSACRNATIYCESASKPTRWSTGWSVGSKTVNWGCKVVRTKAVNGTVTIDGTRYAFKGDDCSLWYLKSTTNGTATITATANSVHPFIRWNDNNTTNSRTINVRASVTYTAIFEAHTETYKFENIQTATCTVDGSQDSVVYCTVCDEELYRETLVIPATGHNYGAPTYSWADDGSACTAKVVCQNDETHIATEDATITSEETVAPTCEEEGTTTYTAVFENELFTTQTKAVVDIPALRHNYGAPTYEWADDGSTCTATAVCLRDETHVATEDATITSEETVAPTCEEEGTTTYTAVFENEPFTTQTKDVVDIPANGHKADSIVFENQNAATCTTVGTYDSVVYCSVCQIELFRVEKEVAATGHSYSAAVTAPTCIAVGYTTHTCSVCEHTYNSDTVAAKGHTEVIDSAVAATCTASGKTEGKHCTICNNVIVAQTEIPALGHDFKDYTYNNDASEESDGTKTATCSRCGEKDTQVAEGTKLVGIPENNGTAVSESAANDVNIYAHGNTIVVENATDEIRVYDAMGKLICMDATSCVRAEINVNGTGVYIVKTGGIVKRVMVR